MKKFLLAFMAAACISGSVQAESAPNLVIIGVYNVYLCDEMVAMIFLYADGHTIVLPPNPDVIAAVEILPESMRAAIGVEPEDGCQVPSK